MSRRRSAARRKAGKRGSGRALSLLSVVVLVLLAVLSAWLRAQEQSKAQSFSLEQIPEYFGEPYVVLQDNQPDFGLEDLTLEPFEIYSELDALGRCGVAYANNGKIKRIATGTFIITPYTVDLTGDDVLDELESNGLYF